MSLYFPARITIFNIPPEPQDSSAFDLDPIHAEDVLARHRIQAHGPPIRGDGPGQFDPA
jgi:hypothetical protein